MIFPFNSICRKPVKKWTQSETLIENRITEQPIAARERARSQELSAENYLPSSGMKHHQRLVTYCVALPTTALNTIFHGHSANTQTPVSSLRPQTFETFIVVAYIGQIEIGGNDK